jgi:hypothetical protein
MANLLPEGSYEKGEVFDDGNVCSYGKEDGESSPGS